MYKLLALLLAGVLTACSASAASEPVSLDGAWQSVEKSNDMFRFSAVVNDGEMTIYIVDDNTRSLYWMGTVPETVENGDIFTSIADQEELEFAILGSLDESKDFTYDNNTLQFEGGMMGIIQTFTMRKVS